MKSIKSCVFKIRQFNMNGTSCGQRLEYHCWCCYCTWWAILQRPLKLKFSFVLICTEPKSPAPIACIFYCCCIKVIFSASVICKLRCGNNPSEAVNSEYGLPCIHIFFKEIFTSFLSIGSISSGKDRSIFANVHSFPLKLHSCKGLL